MSQENVELALRADDAFKRGDLDAFLALCDPDRAHRIVQLPDRAPEHGETISAPTGEGSQLRGAG
jgi:hypothetical protein